MVHRLLGGGHKVLQKRAELKMIAFSGGPARFVALTQATSPPVAGREDCAKEFFIIFEWLYICALAGQHTVKQLPNPRYPLSINFKSRSSVFFHKSYAR